MSGLTVTRSQACVALREAITVYAPLSTETWALLQSACTIKLLAKGACLYSAGHIARSFGFVYTGLLRAFVTDNAGNEYNKNFFDEASFPGSMASLLTQTPSSFTFEALEPSVIVTIDFARYRSLLRDVDDLKWFHILYLEKNWLLEKEVREIQIIQENASIRYQRFVENHPSLCERIPQYHIASHLGITPTQLSRIRKNKY